jgi:ATP-binding cassette subfamily B (MDR/TAP) protein 1
VFEALKRWRRNKTTIVITHDLSQISPTDFAYVLKEGAVVECGYRGDLEVAGGEFEQMAMTQAEAGGFALKEEDEYSPEAVRRRDEAEKIIRSQSMRSPSFWAVKPESTAPQLITASSWIFEVVEDLTRSGRRASTQRTSIVPERNTTRRPSRFVPVELFIGDSPPVPLKRRPSTLAIDIPSPSPAHTTASRHHLSLQVSPISPVYRHGVSSSSILVGDSDGEGEKNALTHAVSSRRRFYDGAPGKRVRKRWDAIKVEPFEGRTVKAVTVEQPPQVDTPQESLISVLRGAYRTMPYKPLIGLGIVFAAISGATTPIFSYMLSQLLIELSKGTQDASIINVDVSKSVQDVSIVNAEVSKGAQDVSTINAFGGIILAVAIADSLFVGLRFITLETAGQLWVSHVRTVCYPLVLAQDKRWFDLSENTASKLCYALMYDGYDATELISEVIAQGVAVVSMLTVGLIWALACGWQLALVGFGIGLVFILTMVLQSRLLAKCELRNRRAREEVARGYYHVGLESFLVYAATY